jgi:hypothetical protein
MPVPSLSRLPVLAAVCGAVLFGWSIGGVASVDSAALPQAQRHHEHAVLDHGHNRHDEL